MLVAFQLPQNGDTQLSKTTEELFRQRARRSTKVKMAAVAIAVGFGLGATQLSNSVNAGSLSRMHQLHTRGAQHQSTSGGNLLDHGGAVLSSAHVYLIFWGSSSAWSSDVQPGLTSLFGGLNGTSFVKTANQYRSAGSSVTYVTARNDSSTPPKHVSTGTLGAEVAHVYGSVDPNGYYSVYTSNFPSGGGFCAWHGATTVNGTAISVAYMPNTAGVAGCDPGNQFNLSGSEGLRSLANVSSHEFMEAVTDPQLNAWYDQSGSEIGDKCAWQFASPVTLNNGSVWQLQTEWSNAAGGCVQTS